MIRFLFQIVVVFLIVTLVPKTIHAFNQYQESHSLHKTKILSKNIITTEAKPTNTICNLFLEDDSEDELIAAMTSKFFIVTILHIPFNYTFSFKGFEIIQSSIYLIYRKLRI